MSKHYTLDEIAQSLRVSYTTIWREVRDGKLRATRVRGRLRVTQDDLDKYFANPANREPSEVSEKQTA